MSIPDLKFKSGQRCPYIKQHKVKIVSTILGVGYVNMLDNRMVTDDTIHMFNFFVCLIKQVVDIMNVIN